MGVATDANDTCGSRHCGPLTASFTDAGQSGGGKQVAVERTHSALAVQRQSSRCFFKHVSFVTEHVLAGPPGPEGFCGPASGLPGPPVAGPEGAVGGGCGADGSEGVQYS